MLKSVVDTVVVVVVVVGGLVVSLTIFCESPRSGTFANAFGKVSDAISVVIGNAVNGSVVNGSVTLIFECFDSKLTDGEGVIPPVGLAEEGLQIVGCAACKRRLTVLVWY